MNNEPRVLIVEDEPPMQFFLRSLLEGHDLNTIVCGTAKEGTLQAASHSPDLILLDLGLPDGSGMEVVQTIRAWSQVPIIVISARGRDRDKVEALDGGADDYLTKPFSAEELMARVRVALRRSAAQRDDGSSMYAHSGMVVDLAQRRVTRNGEEIHLTPTEYKLLQMLVQHAGRVLTHAQILKQIWGPNAVDKPHYVRVHMHQLRSKIQPDGEEIIHTDAGVGYRISESEPLPT